MFLEEPIISATATVIGLPLGLVWDAVKALGGAALVWAVGMEVRLSRASVRLAAQQRTLLGLIQEITTVSEEAATGDGMDPWPKLHSGVTRRALAALAESRHEKEGAEYGRRRP